MYSYFPEPSKNVLVVDLKFEDVSLFSDVGVKVVSGWGDFLGMTKMVMKVLWEGRWIPKIMTFLQCKWMQCEWVFPGQSHLFEPL